MGGWQRPERGGGQSPDAVQRVEPRPSRPPCFTPLLEAQSLGRLRALYDQPVKGPGASLRLFAVPAKSDRGPSPSCRAPVERG